LALTILALVGWYAYNHYELQGLRTLKLVPRGASVDVPGQRPAARTDAEPAPLHPSVRGLRLPQR
jgi:hypothetical protein